MRWLTHRLAALGLNQLNKAAAVPGLNREDAYRQELLLPPLSEQRRIASILDLADTLRAKRRETMAQLDSLVQSIFIEMFGDPTKNLKQWPVIRLREVLTVPLRNGISPSKSGKFAGQVLTLSAITGSRFNEMAYKQGTFQVPLSADQAVDENDFLICRGNGNIKLVGKGYFPVASMPDVVFPDTMIAARVGGDKVAREFLGYIWNSQGVRGQIESLARTTNGTFKVNQGVVEGIEFIAPPFRLQQQFSRRVSEIERLKSRHYASLAELDALCESLRYRAFRGEL